MSRRYHEIAVAKWKSEQEWKRFVSEHPSNLELYGLLFLIAGLLAFACLVIR